ncbi:MAG: hypothetical protein ACO2PN_22205 [Pyrobaculum sp.]|jgi:hypothetical protein
MTSGKTHGGPFAEVRTLADIVLESGCKKSLQFLNTHFDLCVLAILIKSIPAGSMVRLRPEIVRRLVEEVAAAVGGGDRERIRNALLKRAGEMMAQLRRELGDSAPSEAYVAKLAELFLMKLEA